MSPEIYRVHVNATPPWCNTGPFKSTGDKHRFTEPIKTPVAIFLIFFQRSVYSTGNLLLQKDRATRYVSKFVLRFTRYGS